MKDATESHTPFRRCANRKGMAEVLLGSLQVPLVVVQEAPVVPRGVALRVDPDRLREVRHGFRDVLPDPVVCQAARGEVERLRRCQFDRFREVGERLFPQSRRQPDVPAVEVQFRIAGMGRDRLIEFERGLGELVALHVEARHRDMGAAVERIEIQRKAEHALRLGGIPPRQNPHALVVERIGEPVGGLPRRLDVARRLALPPGAAPEPGPLQISLGAACRPDHLRQVGVGLVEAALPSQQQRAVQEQQQARGISGEKRDGRVEVGERPRGLPDGPAQQRPLQVSLRRRMKLDRAVQELQPAANVLGRQRLAEVPVRFLLRRQRRAGDGQDQQERESSHRGRYFFTSGAKRESLRSFPSAGSLSTISRSMPPFRASSSAARAASFSPRRA